MNAQVRRNFEPDFLDLSKQAKDVLKTVDAGLQLYAERNKQLKELKLYPRQWDALEKSLQEDTKGDISLVTHNYRGVKLVKVKKDFYTPKRIAC